MDDSQANLEDMLLQAKTNDFKISKFKYLNFKIKNSCRREKTTKLQKELTKWYFLFHEIANYKIKTKSYWIQSSQKALQLFKTLLSFLFLVF